MILIPGSGNSRHGTETELLRNGSFKTRKLKNKKNVNPSPNPEP